MATTLDGRSVILDPHAGVDDAASTVVVTRHIERIAIVNRGEPAMRLIHAVREFNGDRGLSLRTVALYTESDRRALFVREADEAVLLGPALVQTAGGPRHSAYIDYELLEAGLRAARADAAWVGWGFVAERPDFAEMCERLGIVFIGPSPAAMRLLGDKIRAKRIAEETGAAVGLWSGGPVETVAAAHAAGERIGYPLMVKASAGGGGRGIRRVQAASDLERAFEGARAEAAAAFGDGTLFMERLMPFARHVEVQVVGDGRGTTWAVGIRDCSVQRHHQKLLEESASTVLDEAAARLLRDASVRLANQVGYRGAGTVEFLIDPATKTAMFNEFNARLQVEHPVTEATTGVDLVKLQLHLAMGGSLAGEPPPARGHAVEVRLCAEDPENGFAPAPGVVDVLRLPTGPGIRVDTGIAEGDTVAPEFDSMVAKIIAWGADRSEALSRLRRAVAETTVVLRGGTTNRAFLLDLLRRPEVRDGTADIGWLDRGGMASPGPRPHAGAALLLAAAEVAAEQVDTARAQFYASAARGRPRVPDLIGAEVELRLGGQRYMLHVEQRGATEWTVELDGRRADVVVEPMGRYERRLECLGGSHRVLIVAQRAGFLVEIDGVPHRISRDEGGIVHSPSPAVVSAIRVAPGDLVEQGDVLAMLEAMKMEMPLCAPYAGRVSRILVAQNMQVDTGAAVLQLEAMPEESDQTAAPVERVSLPQQSPDGDPAGACRKALDALRRLMLGYDVGASEAATALADYARERWRLTVPDPGVRRAEDEVLGAFADGFALSRRQPAVGDSRERAGAAQERLFGYLRTLDARGQSASFAEALGRALAHHSITNLERTPQLENALFRIVCAHHRADEETPVVLRVLDRRLDDVVGGEPVGGDDYRLLLDRLLRATRRRLPPVADLAREVRHRCFDQPLMEHARSAVYTGVEERLARLAQVADRGSAERAAIIDFLVNCPQPLHNLLTSRFAGAEPALRGTMLEVMLRRYYRSSTLQSVRMAAVGPRMVATAEVGRGQDARHVVSAFAPAGMLGETLSALAPLLEALPSGEGVCIDVYMWDDSSPDVESVAATGRQAIGDAGLPACVRRVVLAVTGPRRGPGVGTSQKVTFRRTGAHFREERLYRGLHPAMAQRLHVGRLRNFRIERLPSVEDVYLFHGVAKSNPKDERLFAMAEVRDVTPVRDEAGRVSGLPHLERMLLEALAGIRTWQSHRAPADRTEWNRVLLYVRPPIELDAFEIRAIVRRLAPETEGLGLEKVVVEACTREADGGDFRDATLSLSNPLGRGVVMLRFDAPARRPLQPLDEYRKKVVAMRRRGLAYPYEIVGMLAPSLDHAARVMPPGEFVEHDLGEHDELVPVDRPYGRNTANLVVGVISNRTAKHPEGMTRVILLGDASRSMGTLAEPECRRVMAALRLATRMQVPLEWFTLSSGAKIAMDSGTENMDWIARVLRHIIEFTQAGGEINLVVSGINVGAQPYWNAEATMLMHTRGILVMTPDGSMVLTGKQALDYSGSVSAEDNIGIGGYERIMGPNGQAQYWAPDLTSACQLLLRHYEHTYVVPGERFPRRAVTTDPFDRDISTSPHPHPDPSDFEHVGEIFADEHNPGRKKPFDIRAVMRAVADSDHEPLERWMDMGQADTAVVWDVHVGGHPVCLLGLESHPLPRRGFVPADGRDIWTAGTLFPMSSKKLARAVNATSGNRPLVALANLTGFDGSPESMRRLQLEFGAEIGRAIVNFRGPIVFCVISRYHGGAFVVFSSALNENMEVAALEGSHASVIGGIPAAAVVFAREVNMRTRADPRVTELSGALAVADPNGKAQINARLASLREQVRDEKLGEVAAEFDAIHTVQRAQRVGSVHRIIPPSALRPYVIDAVERGIARELGTQR